MKADDFLARVDDLMRSWPKMNRAQAAARVADDLGLPKIRWEQATLVYTDGRQWAWHDWFTRGRPTSRWVLCYSHDRIGHRVPALISY